MTEFEKGDRVKVEFEAIVQTLDDGGRVVLSNHNNASSIWIPPEFLTKLHDPLPTKEGATIFYDGVAYQLQLGDWYAVGNENPMTPTYLADYMGRHGFTVLYAGDDA